MKRDQESVCKLLRETVGVLCRSGLQFSVGLRVQGLLAVTVDNSDVFVVQFDDLLRPEKVAQTPKQQEDSNIQQTGPHLPISSTQLYNSCVNPPTISRRQLQCRPFSKQQIASSNSADDVITINDDADDENLSDSYQESGDEATAGPTDSESLLALNLKPSAMEHCSEQEMKFADLKYDAADSSFGNYNADVDHVVYADVDDGGGDSDQTEILDIDCKPGTLHGDSLKSFNSPAQFSTSLADTSGKPEFVKQEHRTQPAARRIISKYRQHKQTTGTAASSSAPYVATHVMHECTYPNCGKQFNYSTTLLRHQTQKHGRLPTRMLALQRVWVRPGTTN